MSKDKKRREPERENRPLRVGDSVMRSPVTFSGGEGRAKLMRGTVVCIHPAGRFHVVEFSRGIREAFFGVMLPEGGGAGERKEGA